MRTFAGALSAFGLLSSIIVANFLTSEYGFVSVGFGLAATAGTFAFGFALALRDATQDLLGWSWMLAVIGLGSVVSYVIADPMIAVASAAAFLLAEMVDFAIYTPLRIKSKLGDWRWASAVVLSSLAGAVIDTLVFLVIAFGWAAVTVAALAGQLVGKAYATVLYLLIGKALSWSSTSPTPAEVVK